MGVLAGVACWKETVSFADHYRDLVIPQLQRLIIAEAACCAHGVETFMGAWCAVMNQARILGAHCLPDDVFDDLEDWVSTTLLHEIQAAELTRACA